MKKKFIILGAGVATALCIEVCLLVYAITQADILTIKSPYQSSEAGYDKVYLKPDLFCSTTMKDKSKVELQSELKTDKNKYLYDDETQEVISNNRDYLYEGKYGISVELGHSSEAVCLSIIDTTAPLFTDFSTALRVEQGISQDELAEYFPIFDYDDNKTLVLFVQDIDMNKPQKTKATVVAHDSHGNYNALDLNLQILSHKEAKKKTKKPEKDDESEKVRFKIKSSKDKESYLRKLDAMRDEYIKAEEEFASKLLNKAYKVKVNDSTKGMQEDLLRGEDIEDVIKEREEKKEDKKEEKEETKDKEEQGKKDDNKKKQEPEKIKGEEKEQNNSKNKKEEHQKPDEQKDKSELVLWTYNPIQTFDSDGAIQARNKGFWGYYETDTGKLLGTDLQSAILKTVKVAKDKNGLAVTPKIEINERAGQDVRYTIKAGTKAVSGTVPTTLGSTHMPTDKLHLQKQDLTYNKDYYEVDLGKVDIRITNSRQAQYSISIDLGKARLDTDLVNDQLYPEKSGSTKAPRDFIYPGNSTKTIIMNTGLFDANGKPITIKETIKLGWNLPLGREN